MSDNAAITAANPKNPRKRIIILAISFLVLLLIYGAGFILLPVTILTNVRNRNCDSVLSFDRIYTSLYPRFIQDGTLSAPAGECAAYISAASKEENEKWQEAYDAYQGYSNTYPGGMYAREAHEHAARMLMNIVEDQIEGEKYGDALTNLNRIVADYSDTSPSSEAWTLFPGVYTSWGTEMREAGNFEGAERLFHDFETWIQTNQKAELEADAQRELAQTYLDWGLSFQSQKQYENALAKFDLAVAADPQSQLDTTAQVRTGQRKVYLEWGNDFLAQNQYPAAIEKFQLAASHAEGDEDDGAADALANGHIQWAHSLNSEEDFLAALEHLKTAKETALSDEMKKSVEAVFGETYLAFSKSSGSQARRAMKEALKTVCEKHKAPDLPIFGLNKDLVRAAIYGVDAEFPEDLQATTPGEMHYVACVEVQRETIASDYNDKYYRLMGGDTVYVTFIFYRYRVQVNWSISLRKSNTGEEVATELFKGALPPNFPREWKEETYEGAPPDTDAVLKWLRSVIK